MVTSVRLYGRIAILGSGREGMAAYRHLSAQGTGDRPDIITEGLSGQPGEAELQAQGALRICSFDEASLEKFDVLVRSPGVSLYRACIQKAINAGVRVVTPSTLWFAENPDANTIVITGTKGKSTTSALLAHLLKTAGLNVRLAGNIGTPLLACEEKNIDWWVIELSSYQLADLEATPTIGVLLNLATDHLDWHGNEIYYHRDKLRLADLVSEGDLIANCSDRNLAEKLSGRAEVQWFEGYSDEAAKLNMPASLPGKHNRANLAACLAVTRKLSLADADVLSGLDTFVGLPHRLSKVHASNGVTFVDDSISTAPVATVAALESFSDKEVILLVGGYERGIDWAPYAEAIARHPPAAVIALPDNGPRILKALELAGIQPKLGSLRADNLQKAVAEARKIAPAGAVVLLSPGAPSFPQFRNFEDRGRQFAEFCSQAGEAE